MKGSLLAVRVTGLTRPEPDVLELGLTIVNAGKVPAHAPPRGSAGAPGEEWLAGLSITDEQRLKRFYVLRDMSGRPRCTTGLGEFPPGAVRSATARFPAPGPDAGRVTVVVPGVPPIREVPFPPGTPAAGPSY